MRRLLGVFIFSLVLALAYVAYYFYFFKLSFVNSVDKSIVDAIICNTSSGKKYEVYDLGYNAEAVKYVYLGAGQRLECDISVKGYSMETILVIGYYDWNIKDISMQVIDNKILIFDESGKDRIQIDSRDLKIGKSN